MFFLCKDGVVGLEPVLLEHCPIAGRQNELIAIVLKERSSFGDRMFPYPWPCISIDRRQQLDHENIVIAAADLAMDFPSKAEHTLDWAPCLLKECSMGGFWLQRVVWYTQ